MNSMERWDLKWRSRSHCEETADEMWRGNPNRKVWWINLTTSSVRIGKIVLNWISILHCQAHFEMSRKIPADYSTVMLLLLFSDSTANSHAIFVDQSNSGWEQKIHFEFESDFDRTHDFRKNEVIPKFRT
jgi:hypothetical protein